MLADKALEAAEEAFTVAEDSNAIATAATE